MTKTKKMNIPVTLEELEKESAHLIEQLLKIKEMRQQLLDLEERGYSE